MNPFDILGVSKDASEEEIKSAYRKLARLYHPDENPDNEAAAERMNQINAAYQFLKDPEGRRQAAEDEFFDFFTFENDRTMEPYEPPRRNIFQSISFRRSVLLLIIVSMLLLNVGMIFYQALNP